MATTKTPTTKSAAVKRAASKGVAAKKASATKAAKAAASSEERIVPGKYTKPKLRPTETPGVFESEMGVRCDHRGVALAILGIRARSEDQEREVLGKLAETPAEVLKVAALDRSLALPFRVDAAAKAAPYFDRKMPQAVDGGADPNNPSGPGLPINISDLKGLSTAELAQLKALLLKAKPSEE